MGPGASGRVGGEVRIDPVASGRVGVEAVMSPAAGGCVGVVSTRTYLPYIRSSIGSRLWWHQSNDKSWKAGWLLI
jgi:hypothetical protein